MAEEKALKFSEEFVEYFDLPEKIAVIGSPLQLLCAVEACGVDEAKSTLHVLVVENHNKRNTEILKNLIKELELRSVTYMPPAPKYRVIGPLLNYFAIKRQVSSLKKHLFKEVFVGHLRPTIWLVSNNLMAEKFTMVDDGTTTLLFSERFTMDVERYFRRNLRGLLCKLFGLETKAIVSRLRFFTVYSNVEIYFAGNQLDISYNNFENVSRALGATHRSEWSDVNEVWIIGSGWSENGFLPLKDEVQLYQEFADRLRVTWEDSRVVYFPHRDERSEKLRQLSESLGFALSAGSLPVECHCLINAIKPRAIFSVCSSALRNLDIIVGGGRCYLIGSNSSFKKYGKMERMSLMRELLINDYGMKVF